MSAPTAHVGYVLAQAGQRGGMMHLSSQRDTGALNPMCGANPVRSKEIRTWSEVPADLSALCADCAAAVTSHPLIATVELGLAIYLGAEIAPTVHLLEVPIDSITVRLATRRADEELVESVRAFGILQPITARRTGSGLELVVGGRRLHAARAAGLSKIPTLVRDVDDERATLDALTENLHRADLDPIAQARAYSRALEVLGGTITDLADRLHVSRPRVSNTLRLLELPTDLQRLVADGTLSAAHGRALLRFPEGSEEQRALAEQIVAEGMSTHDAEHAAKTATSTPATRLVDVSTLLAVALEQAGLLGSKVRVTTSADRARIVLDVADADLPRVLARLQAAE